MKDYLPRNNRNRVLLLRVAFSTVQLYRYMAGQQMRLGLAGVEINFTFHNSLFDDAMKRHLSFGIGERWFGVCFTWSVELCRCSSEWKNKCIEEKYGKKISCSYRRIKLNFWFSRQKGRIDNHPADAVGKIWLILFQFDSITYITKIGEISSDFLNSKIVSLLHLPFYLSYSCMNIRKASRNQL